MLVRAEGIGDHSAIEGIHRAAFDGGEEAKLVELLRKAGLIIASLVAINDAAGVVGHILFSPATIVATNTEMRVASLAPMAVEPEVQHRGIGSMLIEHGLQACQDAGYRAVIVVGHPAYYPRFGFSNGLVAQLTNPFSAGQAFMGLELARGSLSDLREGRVVYPDVFNHPS